MCSVFLLCFKTGMSIFPSAWKAKRSGQNILWNRLLILHQKLKMKWKCTNVDKNKSWHCDLNTEELWSGDRKSTSWGRGGCAIKHVRAAWTVPLKGSGRPESGRQGGGVYLPSYIFWFGFGFLIFHWSERPLTQFVSVSPYEILVFLTNLFFLQRNHINYRGKSALPFSKLWNQLKVISTQKITK